MEPQLQDKLDVANEALGAIMPYRLEVHNPSELKLLDKNARFMRNETFQQLVENVRRDGALQSLPLIYRDTVSGQRIVLSGNHRVMAARTANLNQILCLVIVGEMGSDQQVAIQLAHNAIVGQDDLQVLKDLYDSIGNIEFKVYAGIDEQMRQQLNSIKFSAIAEARMPFKAVNLLFLPPEATELESVLDRVGKLLEDDGTYVLRLNEYQEFFDLIAQFKAGANIKNNSVAILELMRRGMKALQDQLADQSQAPPDEGSGGESVGT